MKTGKYYFGLMTPEEQEKFKSNCGNTPTFEDVILHEHDSFWIFIASAFTWSRTNEGKNYWSKIAHKYE